MRLLLAIALTGVLVGLIGALFLMALQSAGAVRIALISIVEVTALPGWMAGIFLSLTGASLAAWLASRYAPEAPQTGEALPLKKVEQPPSETTSLWVNFAGTSLAIGAGLALGPSRPAIQIGAAIGKMISRVVGLSPSDQNTFFAAAGGAGVATVFSSPLGCAAYTVEVVLKRVDFKVSAMTLGMGGIAVAVARLLSGRDARFDIEMMVPGGAQDLLLFILMGALLAAFGYLHVHLIMFCAHLGQTLAPRPAVRAGVVGGLVGLLAWYAPDLVGNGNEMTQSILDGDVALTTLGMIFLLRFFLGPISLSASTPGGYFAPVLLLGASFGAAFGSVVAPFLTTSDLSPATFAVVGMAVALAAVANAPFTGILLVIETTGAFSLSIPMTAAVLGAMAVAKILKTPSLTHGLEIALRQTGNAGNRHDEYRGA